MADFLIPELGENVASGDVVRIMVKPGDTLKKDQPVLELETDKATIEVPSSVAGVVKELKIKEGEKVKVGQLVLTVDESPAAADKSPAAAAPADTSSASAAAAGTTAASADKAAAAPRPTPSAEPPTSRSRPCGPHSRQGIRKSEPASTQENNSPATNRSSRRSAAARLRRGTQSASLRP